MSSEKVGKTKTDDHYVPKLLLRHFTCSPEQVFVYDKWNSKSFKTNIRNIACESNYNKVTVNEQDIDFEKHFTELEGYCGEIIQKILKSQNLSCLTSTDRAWLGTFINIQRSRTRNQREVIRQMNEELGDHLQKMGADLQNVKGYKKLTEDEIKLISLQSAFNLAKKTAHLIIGKPWVLLRTEISNPFWISDNPVVFSNQKDFGVYGNLGLAVPGVEIYMPLSSTLCLFVMCPTMFKEMSELHSKARKFFDERLRNLMRGQRGNEIPELIAVNRKALNTTSQMINAVKSGLPIEATEENVKFSNHLQVVFSERFVISYLNDFSLAEEMTRDNANYQSALRPTFN